MRRRAAGVLMLCLAGCGGGDHQDGSPADAAPPDAVVADAGIVDAADALPPDAAPDAGLDQNFGVAETDGDPQCDNLLTTNCLFPFPSDFFLQTTPDGRRFQFGPEALPALTSGRHLRTDTLGDADGWGPATPVMVALPGATLTGLVPVFEPERSLDPDARTVILDTVTGERVPHWVEFDWLTRDEPTPVLVLRPAVRFERDRRYVVAIRGVIDAAGAPLPPTPGFAALRDRTASTTVGIHARRQHFEDDVFPVLAAHGVDRADLQLAWDFTTSTEANALAYPVAMRDMLLAAIGDDGPEYTIDSVTDVDDEDIARIVEGTAQVPSFLTPRGGLGPRLLRRDEHGAPVTEGFEAVQFRLQIPRSVLAGTDPVPVVQYGHGFLGTKDEANTRWLRHMANRLGFLVIAADLQGMSTDDAPIWISALSRDPSNFPLLSQPPLQGVMDHLALIRMLKGRFAREADPRLTRDGHPLYDPARLYYDGNSQGGTMGTVITALSTDVRRAILGVPGADFPFLLQRSTDATTSIQLLDRILASRTDLSLLLALLGTGFDHLDPLTYAPHLIRDPLPGTPAHDVLLHVAHNDAQVHNQVSFILGRTVGVPLMVPAIRSVFGLAEQPYPYVGSALVEYDFGVPEPADPMAPPPEETDTHESLRRQPEGQDQAWHFLETGEVANYCGGGPCAFPMRP